MKGVNVNNLKEKQNMRWVKAKCKEDIKVATNYKQPKEFYALVNSKKQ